MLAGPAGTGKTRGHLEKLNACALKYDGMRGLIVRKSRAWLTQTAMVTFEKDVDPFFHGARFSTVKQEYQYTNGSIIAVAGLDKDAQKVMSGQYDIIYVNEETELTEGEHEALTTRLRNGVMPYQQLLADCNPGPPTHWLKKRAERGQTRLLPSTHEDNPVLFDDDGQVTERGAAYLAKLDALTGVRYLRLRKGQWAAAEGMIYEGWDPLVHVIDRDALPRSWRRYWVVDFGYTHPFVWQAWAEDEDGRLYLEHEIHMTGRIVEDHAKQILEVCGYESVRGGRPVPADTDRIPDPLPYSLICDHDAEDRATLERHLGVPTYGAYKAVGVGIQLVQTRLRPAGDGRPRLFVLRNSLVEVDPWAIDHKRPTRLSEEMESYVWDTKDGLPKGEQPVKIDDDSCLIAGTLVDTADGPLPIDQIHPGVMVRTRQGYFAVLDAGQTHAQAQVFDVECSDGRHIVGTGSHPIWVDGNGWCPIDGLRYNDALCVSTTVTESVVNHLPPTAVGARCVPVAETPRMWRMPHMGGGGSWSAIAGMTAFLPSLPTWASALLGAPLIGLTSAATMSQGIAAGPPHKSRRALTLHELPIWKSFVPCWRSGISRMRGGIGTVSMDEPYGGIGSLGRNTVNSVVQSIRRGSRARQRSSARMLVRRLRESLAGWITRRATAPSVEIPSTSTATALSDVAPVRVRSISAQATRRPVFNLSVDGPPEFFANGILVHNCDCLRYMVATLDDPRPSQVQTTIIDQPVRISRF